MQLNDVTIAFPRLRLFGVRGRKNVRLKAGVVKLMKTFRVDAYLLMLRKKIRMEKSSVVDYSGFWTARIV